MDECTPEKNVFDQIDLATKTWWQGDIADAKWFKLVTVGEANTDPSSSSSEANTVPCLVDQESLGLVILTQTCDIRKTSSKRPYLQVSPIVRLEGTAAALARKGQLLNLVPLPGAGDQVFADMDRVMTVEKSFLRFWGRTVGCRNDVERREFGRRVARIHQRFAFPDDLQPALAEMVKRIKKRYKRTDLEGKALQAVEEIRVTASPGWDASEIGVFLTFALSHGAIAAEITDEQWADLLEQWLSLCKPTGVVRSVEGTILPLDMMTAREYLDSDRLELDYLSP